MYAYEPLIKAIGPTAPQTVICLVGAGGKTSALYGLSAHFKGQGLRVIATTTTKIYQPNFKQVDHVHIGAETLPAPKAGEVLAVGDACTPEGKWTGVDRETIDRWKRQKVFDVLICEADGARRRSIKAPRKGEPVVPKTCDIVIGMVGMDVLGKPASNETVHRFELYQEITMCVEGQSIQPDQVATLAVAEKGIFRGVPKEAKKILCLTKTSLSRDRYEAAIQIAEWLEGKLEVVCI